MYVLCVYACVTIIVCVVKTRARQNLKLLV